MERIYAVDLGRRDYIEVLEIQKILEERAERETGYLLISENDPVITVGRSAGEDEVLYSPERLEALGIKRYDTERGGRVTLHGPGQIVGYPILNLEGLKKDLHWYLSSLENIVGRVLERLGIENFRSPGKTGVWTPQGKVCAIGVKVKRWITTHGFALNHTIDLDLFKSINPCGLMGYGLTRIEDHRKGVERERIVEEIYRSVEEEFSCRVERREIEDIL